jgi:hypothetical protein
MLNAVVLQPVDLIRLKAECIGCVMPKTFLPHEVNSDYPLGENEEGEGKPRGEDL